jgi:hypothetical protein
MRIIPKMGKKWAKLRYQRFGTSSICRFLRAIVLPNGEPPFPTSGTKWTRRTNDMKNELVDDKETKNRLKSYMVCEMFCLASPFLGSEAESVENEEDDEWIRQKLLIW